MPSTLKEKVSADDEWDDVEDEKETTTESEGKCPPAHQQTGREIVDYNEETNCFILANGDVMPNTNNMPKEAIMKMIQARTKGKKFLCTIIHIFIISKYKFIVLQ